MAYHPSEIVYVGWNCQCHRYKTYQALHPRTITDDGVALSMQWCDSDIMLLCTHTDPRILTCMDEAVGTIKCVNIHTIKMDRSVEFWTQVLGRQITNQYYPFTELKKDGEITVIIEQTLDPVVTGNGTHFDIKVKDLELAINRVEDLGGNLVEIKNKEKWSWAIMKDPDGNIFCLCN